MKQTTAARNMLARHRTVITRASVAALPVLATAAHAQGTGGGAVTIDPSPWLSAAQQTFVGMLSAGGPVLFAIVAAIAGVLFLLNRVRSLG